METLIQIAGMQINLAEEIKGFSKTKPLLFTDMTGKVRPMLVRDALQYSVANTKDKPTFQQLKHLSNLIPRLDDEVDMLILNDPQEKQFIIDSVINADQITPIPKAFVLHLLNAM